MSEPQFDFADSEEQTPRRRFGGWMALWTIIGLLCASSLWSYFSRDASSDRQYLQVSTAYRTWVLQSEAAKRYPIFGRAGGESLNEGLGSSLDDLIAQVVEGRSQSPNAARLYVSMRYEKGVAIKPQDLALLEKSDKREERAFARVYGTASLPKEEADRLIGTFPDQGFTYTMARIHAREKSGDKGVRTWLLPNSEIVQPLAALALLMGSLFLGMVILGSFLVLRITGKAKPAGHPVGKLNPRRADAFAGTAAIMLFAYLAISIGAQLLLGSFLPGESSSIVGGMLAIGATIFLLTRGKLPNGPGLEVFGYDRSRLGKDILWGVGGFFAGVPLFMTCACFSQFLFSGLPSPDHPLTFDIQSNQSIPMLLLVLGLASVIAPIFEELCFRGVITPATDSLFGGPFMGIVASSLAFAMIHPQGIPGWLPLAMIGGTAAMLAYQRKSLVPAIVYHAVHNCFVLTMTVLML